MAYYTIPIPLGLGTTIEVTFDTLEIAVEVRLLDIEGELIADRCFPSPVRAIVDAYLSTWLFVPGDYLGEGYALDAWVDPVMWAETMGERLVDLAFAGLAERRDGGAHAAA